METAHALWGTLLMLLAATATAALRDVRLVLPPVVRAGGSTTLLCLFDLEGAPLYAVKWYRGTREFFRFAPAERPPARAFPFPGIVVDLRTSSERQVALRSVPPHLSGTFSCEVTADAPSFSTALVSGNLTVIDFPDIKVDSNLFDEGEVLTVNCTYQPLKLPTSLTFYVDNEPAARSLVREWAGGASLRWAPRIAAHASARQLRLRCLLLVDGRFPVASDSVTVVVPRRPAPTQPTASTTPATTSTTAGPAPPQPADPDSPTEPAPVAAAAPGPECPLALALLSWLLCMARAAPSLS